MHPKGTDGARGWTQASVPLSETRTPGLGIQTKQDETLTASRNEGCRLHTFIGCICYKILSFIFLRREENNVGAGEGRIGVAEAQPQSGWREQQGEGMGPLWTGKGLQGISPAPGAESSQPTCVLRGSLPQDTAGAQGRPSGPCSGGQAGRYPLSCVTWGYPALLQGIRTDSTPVHRNAQGTRDGTPERLRAEARPTPSARERQPQRPLLLRMRSGRRLQARGPRLQPPALPPARGWPPTGLPALGRGCSAITWGKNGLRGTPGLLLRWARVLTALLTRLRAGREPEQRQGLSPCSAAYGHSAQEPSLHGGAGILHAHSRGPQGPRRSEQEPRDLLPGTLALKSSPGPCLQDSHTGPCHSPNPGSVPSMHMLSPLPEEPYSPEPRSGCLLLSSNSGVDRRTGCAAPQQRMGTIAVPRASPTPRPIQGRSVRSPLPPPPRLHRGHARHAGLAGRGPLGPSETRSRSGAVVSSTSQPRALD